MKKLLLAAAALMLIGSLKAQSGITVGPKVGWNITNISNSDAKNKMSVNVGAFAEFRFGDFVAVQPEILYSRQGFRDKDHGDKYKIRVNYLNIPILAKLFVWDQLSIDLGPQFGFALNSKAKYKDGDTMTKKDVKSVNTFDFSFVMGVSYNLGRLMLSARYNLGLTNVWDKNDFVWNSGDNNKNHVFQLSVGYRFGDLF